MSIKPSRCLEGQVFINCTITLFIFLPNFLIKIFLQSLEWRKRWKLDSLKDMEIPEVFQRYYPHGLSGYDKEGSPIIIVPFAGFDSNGILHAVSKKEMITVTLRQFEDYLELGREQATKHGAAALKITCIIDMMDFNLKQFTFRPGSKRFYFLLKAESRNNSFCRFQLPKLS